MITEESLTIADKLLVAAYGIAEGKEGPLSAEDIVVAAWQRFPRAFGLRGYNDKQGFPLYPDSNRIYMELMGPKPIRKKGYLKKVGTKLYILTASGLTVARDLRESISGEQAGDAPVAGGKATMSREIRNQLERLLRARAVLRAQSEELDRITFHDACVFWGITAHSQPIELEGAISEIESAIRAAEASIETGGSELRTGGGEIGRSTTLLLHNVHEFLQDRFSSELDTIRRRS